MFFFRLQTRRVNQQRLGGWQPRRSLQSYNFYVTRRQTYCKVYLINALTTKMHCKHCATNTSYVSFGTLKCAFSQIFGGELIVCHALEKLRPKPCLDIKNIGLASFGGKQLWWPEGRSCILSGLPNGEKSAMMSFCGNDKLFFFFLDRRVNAAGFRLPTNNRGSL